jgi:hypothetical protein
VLRLVRGDLTERQTQLGGLDVLDCAEVGAENERLDRAGELEDRSG